MSLTYNQQRYRDRRDAIAQGVELGILLKGYGGGWIWRVDELGRRIRSKPFCQGWGAALPKLARIKAARSGGSYVVINGRVQS